MSDIDLMLDEENELTFQLNIEGSRPADAKCRLRIDQNDMSLVLEAEKHSGGEVIVIVPPLKNIIREGTHNLELEVIVDDKYFTPLQLTANFEKSVKVEAKAKVSRKRKKTSVTSSLVENKTDVSSIVTVKNSKKNDLKVENNISDNDIMRIIKALQRGVK